MIEPAHSVSIGGQPAVELDVHTGDADLPRMLGPENTVRDFDAAVDGLQPLIDSITWGT